MKGGSKLLEGRDEGLGKLITLGNAGGGGYRFVPGPVCGFGIGRRDGVDRY